MSELLKWGKIRAALGVYKENVGIGFEVEGRMMSTLLSGLCMKSWKEKNLVHDAYHRTLCMGKKMEALDHFAAND